MGRERERKKERRNPNLMVPKAKCSGSPETGRAAKAVLLLLSNLLTPYLT